MVTNTRRIYVFHPFLFAVYAILGVYSHNSTEVPVQWVIRPLFVSLCLIAIVYFVLRRRTNDSQYTGLVVTLALFWFFFGHFQRALFEKSPFWATPLGISVALAIWTVPLVFLGSQWAWRHISNRSLVTSFLNLTSVFVVLLPLYITSSSMLQTIRQTSKYESQSSANVPVILEKRPTQPDIYVIILDAYGREDILRDLYNFDNSEFIESLRQKGFYVADQSTANYPQTQLALSSMLNFQYLNASVGEFRDSSDRTLLRELVQHPAIRQLLENQDYKFVALPSPTLVTQIRDADIYLNSSPIDINEFEASLLSSTVIGVVGESWGFKVPVMGYELHRQYTVFTLEKLREISTIPGPKFVFAHIMLPHPPFIFDQDGNFIRPDRPYIMWDGSLFPGNTEEYQKGYSEQVTFLNRNMMTIISDILAQSKNPPIIILQGDHGPGAFFNYLELDNSCLCERFSILNAYYFPDGDYQLLYPSITPVNSFRVILNQYFGAQLALLEDRSYYASWLSPYLYTDVTDQIALPCSIFVEEMH